MVKLTNEWSPKIRRMVERRAILENLRLKQLMLGLFFKTRTRKRRKGLRHEIGRQAG
jgi:hypothetical protein